MKCPVDDKGTISVVASVTPGPERTVGFIHGGDYRVTEYFTELRFVYHGDVAWFASSSNIPGVVTIHRGENVEGVLRRASAHPNMKFYDDAVLPTFLQKPSASRGPNGGQTIGASQITTSGVQ